MKKSIIFIILLLSLLLDVQRVSAAEMGDDVKKRLYPGIGIIYDIDQNTDTVKDDIIISVKYSAAKIEY